MSGSEIELQKIAALAYIKLDGENAAKLAEDVSDILEFVEQLCLVNTDNVEPLCHPLDIRQRLREDDCTKTSQVDKLAEIAPLFENGHYLVPKVIKKGK